jgi:hypothetical protein
MPYSALARAVAIIGALGLLSGCLEHSPSTRLHTNPLVETSKSLLGGADEVMEGLGISGSTIYTFEVYDPPAGGPVWRQVSQESRPFTSSVSGGRAKIPGKPPPGLENWPLHTIVIADSVVRDNPVERRVRVRRPDGSEDITIYSAPRKGEPTARTRHYEAGQLKYEVKQNWKRVNRGWVLSEVVHTSHVIDQLAARATTRFRIERSSPP